MSDSPDAPSATRLLKNIHTLATFNDKDDEIQDAAIYIKGNVVAWVGRTDDLPAEYNTADEILDMTDRVVVPGLVNTHHHMFQCLTRCVAQDQKLFGWLKSLYPAWEHVTGNDVYVACRVAMAELLLSGCTTTSDHHYLFVNGIKLEDTVRAARELGVRFHAVRGAMSRGRSKGGLPPDHVVEDEEEVLKDMERCIQQLHDNSRYSMVRIALGPASQKTVSDDLMRRTAELARSHMGVRLHTHLAENAEDVEYCQRLYGHRFWPYVAGVGWDGPDCWFAHCCMLNGEEMQHFAHSGIGVAHCPASNLRLASGIAPVRQMLDAGVNVGLGTDGSASADCGNLLMHTRIAMGLQRAGGDPKGMSVRGALKLAITGGARNLGRDDIGVLAPGYAADLAAWRMDTLAMAGGGHDPLAAIVLCAAGNDRADTVLVNGRVVVRAGQLTTAQEGVLVSDLRSASQRLCRYLEKGA